jgi:hypothetical protein
MRAPGRIQFVHREDNRRKQKTQRRPQPLAANGKPTLDLSLLCPLCGYRIQPAEVMRLGLHTVKCPCCGEVFDEKGGKKPLSTS